jgi:hypothetical protein
MLRIPPRYQNRSPSDIGLDGLILNFRLPGLLLPDQDFHCPYFHYPLKRFYDIMERMLEPDRIAQHFHHWRSDFRLPYSATVLKLIEALGKDIIFVEAANDVVVGELNEELERRRKILKS